MHRVIQPGSRHSQLYHGPRIWLPTYIRIQIIILGANSIIIKKRKIHNLQPCLLRVFKSVCVLKDRLFWASKIFLGTDFNLVWFLKILLINSDNYIMSQLQSGNPLAIVWWLSPLERVPAFQSFRCSQQISRPRYLVHCSWTQIILLKKARNPPKVSRCYYGKFNCCFALLHSGKQQGWFLACNQSLITCYIYGS